MSKNGFLVFDSDMHIMEPPDLWQKYIDKKYLEHAPIGLTSDNVRDLRVTWPEDGDKATPAGINRLGHNYERNQKLYKSDSERGWVSEVQLEAMDIEGIDVAVMFPSRGLSVLTRPNMDNDFAAAIVSCDLLSVGMDIERLGRIKEKLYDKFFTPSELASINEMTDWEVETIIFSAKESIYKAIYFIVQRYVKFKEVELTLNAEDSSFSVSYIGENMMSLRNLETRGYWSICKDHVLTAVEIR